MVLLLFAFANYNDETNQGKFKVRNMTDKFNAWKQNADMPMTDAFDNWYDAETGLYFDQNSERPVDQQLYQYYGKRVTFKERKDRKIIVSINNSRCFLIAEKVIVREVFDRRPSGNNEQVEWACEVVGISIK